jgi:hypothetical protein
VGNLPPMKIFITLACLFAYTAGVGGAQTMPPADTGATASPSPAPTPPRSHKIFANGPHVIVVGAAISPRITSEFSPASTTGLTSFEGWQTGETTLFGRFHVFSFTDYRSVSYDHQGQNAVATIGGHGSATVSSFRVHDDELESGGGVRVLPRVFLGASLFARRENSGYPPLKGVGYTIMFAPALERSVTPYGWISYEPNAGGIYALADGAHTALTYRGFRYRFGVLIKEPGTRFILDVGFASENLYDRTNVPDRLRSDMLTIGLGVHF